TCIFTDFFFFQAEDGIRDLIVTGVQTCALPISPTICRRCYIHPAVLEGYFEGTMLQTLADNTRKYLAANIEGMSAEEAAVAAFLRFRLDKLAEQDRTKSAA